MTGTAISVVGLGKLGACMAASFANFGYSVTGADLDESIVEAIEDGSAPFPEPHLEEYVREAGADLSATTDTAEAIAGTDATFVVVNTPSSDAGRYSLEHVNEVCETIGTVLAEKSSYHLVVLTSTVFPGSTRGRVRKCLERVSGKAAGDDFGLCYSPEFIAIGDVIGGLEDPDFFLIGEYSRAAGDVLESIYEEWGADGTPIVRLSTTEAEIAKMALNSYVTMKISYANTLGQICDHFGADVDAVTGALAEDGRISANYLTAGSRFGGPCFPRDNRAFRQLARAAETKAPLAAAADETNDHHTAWLADIVRREANGDSVGILGLTYKPGTYIVEESQGVGLIDELSDEFELICYDPQGNDMAEQLYPDVEYVHSLDAALDVDTAVLTVRWDEFEEIEAYEGKSLTLIDPWRAFDPDLLPARVTYRPVGRSR